MRRLSGFISGSGNNDVRNFIVNDRFDRRKEDKMSVSKVYNEKYAGGYGLQYPDGHIIRIYNYLESKYKLSERENKTILDFGCGTGVHSIFFERKGFDAYGVDVSDIAIEKYNENLNHCIDEKQKNNMGRGRTIRGFCVDNSIPLHEVLNQKFDVILANQSLYYLSNTDLEIRLGEMYSLLKDDGIVIFTMMSSENYYYQYVEGSKKDGMSFVKLKGRLNEDVYINFVGDEEDLCKKFYMFRKDMVGYYDFIMEEGSSKHYYFIGRK